MLLCKAYHLALVCFLFYFPRIANGAFHHIKENSSVVLSALCKQPQVWILFCLCVSLLLPVFLPRRFPIRLLSTALAAVTECRVLATLLPITS